MSAATGAGSAGSLEDGTRVPWVDVVMSAVAAVSWALIGMAGTAALGLHLLEADSAGSLGTMTAAVVALAAGGSVTPSGDVSAFGLSGAEADTAVDITPLGVSLVGALLLAYFFLRSLRAAGVVVSRAELLARAGTVVALFVAMTGGLVWAGHDVITLDGGALGLDELPGGGGGGGGIEIPGLGDLGDVGGLLPDRIGDLVEAEAAVGFTVDAVPTLLGGLGWSAGVLLVALLASRRTPLPRGWDAVHRAVRPAVSALVTVLLVAVVAGLAAAAYAAIGDDHPRRIAGAALLGAPNGVWLGLPLGLFVPWEGRASGALLGVLPDPLDDLLRVDSDQPVTLARLAELDGRVWLLAVAAAVTMLLAGVLTGVRTPVGGAGRGGTPPGGRGGRAPGQGAEAVTPEGRPEARMAGRGAGVGVGAFVGRCALRLGVATALALPLLAWLTGVSVNASLSVLGVDAFGAGIDLRGRLGLALLLGAAWGAGAGAAGAWLAWVCGAAGRRAVSWAAPVGAGPVESGGGGETRWRAGGAEHGHHAAAPGYGDAERRAAYGEGGGRRAEQRYGDEPGPGRAAARGYGEQAAERRGHGEQGAERGAGLGYGEPGRGGPEQEAGRGTGQGHGEPRRGGPAGPYAPGVPYRPPNPDTNPYLRVPEELGVHPEPGEAAGVGDGEGDDDVYGAPTVIAPVEPPRREDRRGDRRADRRGDPPRGPRASDGERRASLWPDEGPPPPPPPPPAPPPRPRKPDGGR
ncbi:streptophobe family protein [Streptomyces sp. NPDC052013]|uniref:streptophobe family protein n=1 Tax=Streptomyces sp. NPDC052013 TaxID=3365679 RepID=UPI0037D2C2A3